MCYVFMWPIVSVNPLETEVLDHTEWFIKFLSALTCPGTACENGKLGLNLVHLHQRIMMLMNIFFSC